MKIYTVKELTPFIKETDTGVYIQNVFFPGVTLPELMCLAAIPDTTLDALVAFRRGLPDFRRQQAMEAWSNYIKEEKET